MAATLVRPLTETGTLLLVVVPLPNCPTQLYPQAQTVPSLFSARPCRPPPAMAVTPVRPITRPGVGIPNGIDAVEPPVVPLPSCPWVFCPQAQTLPSLVRARLCSAPLAMAVTFVRPLTCAAVA